MILGSVSGLWYLSSLSEFFVRQTALESARLETKMLDEVWRFYSEEISDIDPKTTNVSITENYRDGAPGPAPAGNVRHRPGRADQPPQPGHGSSRLQPLSVAGPRRTADHRANPMWLRSSILKRMPGPAIEPPAEFSRFTADDGRRKLLYYTARHMEKSCIGCHNHPDSRSPKKDWKEGDVVGVLKIVRPLDHEIDNTRKGLRGAFTLMGTIATLLLVISVAVMT